MEIRSGSPLRGKKLERVKRFLERFDIAWDGKPDYSVYLMFGGEVVATGSLVGNTLGWIAADPIWQEQGLTSTVLVELVREARARGEEQLLLHSRPQDREMYEALGFSTLVRTEQELLMENGNIAELIRREERRLRVL